MRCVTNRPRILAAALVVALGAMPAQAFQLDPAGNPGLVRTTNALEPGLAAPASVAESIAGEEITLEAFAGQYVILEFWAMWCAPSYPKIPYLRELWSNYGGKGLQIIGISLDGEQRLPDLQPFMERHAITWPQVLEGPRTEGPVTELYDVVGIPDSYLIGPDGTIIARNLRIEELAREVRMRLGSSE
ncbi:MAG: TlpA family protein disulfide reductase [Rhodothermales bacterium]|nr:TlpA family protein disulfide reductase [Rhodothermales bacterium]